MQQQNQVHFGAGVEKHTESPKVAPISQIAQYGSSEEKRLHQEMQEYITNFTKTGDEYEEYIQEKAQNESKEQKIQQENAKKLSNYELVEKQKLAK